MKSIGEGVFVRLSPEIAEKFWSVIEAAGYERTSEGVIAFVLDEGEEAVEENFAARYMRENPEKVRMAGEAIFAAAKTILKRKA